MWPFRSPLDQTEDASILWRRVRCWISRSSILEKEDRNIAKFHRKNAGVGKILAAVREASQKKIKAEADKLKAIAETIENDAQMQEAKAEMAQRWLEESFAHIGSCPQCNLRFGSTCCNPDKISAKQQAEKDKASEMGWDAPIQGDYDKKRYREIYSKILMDRAHAMTSDEKPLTSKDKGGGPKIDANGSVQKRNQVQ